MEKPPSAMKKPLNYKMHPKNGPKSVTFNMPSLQEEFISIWLTCFLRKSEDEDDESIPSDEEEDEEEETPKSSEESVPQMNMKECEQILSKRHNLFKRFR